MGISALLFGSCGQETPSDRPLPPISANTLRLSVEMESMNQQLAKTRAEVAALPDEKTIGSLYLLFFESKSDNSGRFVDYVEIADPAGINQPNDIDMTGTSLSVTDAYHILALANIHGEAGKRYLNGMEPAAWMLQWAGKTEQEVIAEARAWASEGFAITSGGLLMNGRVEKPADVFEVTVPLVRNQVRLDIINKESEYTLVSVEIRNAYPVSQIWSDESGAGIPDYSENTSRIRTYYGFEDAGVITNPLGEVRGNLYIFENQVAMSGLNDRFTSSLILGMLKEGESVPTYYRVNVAPKSSPQMLQRNHAYSVTINTIGGPGQSDPDAAYNYPNDNRLDYMINAGGLEESGMIEQDEYSVLSSPYKTVNLNLAGEIIGHDINQGQDARSFRIITFTRNTNRVSQLEILEQEYHLNGNPTAYTGIEAEINGNILTFIKSESIASGNKVEGTIRLGYAGLRATINVVQTDLTSDFLNVFLPDGGLPSFASFGGIESGLLHVEASGPWTAEILSEKGGFAFSANGGTMLSSTTDAALLTDGKKFSIRTVSDNTDEEIREAFILVRLAKDPENYCSVIMITQQRKASIAIVPSQSVTFDGTGALALIPNNTIQTFNVRPGQFADETPVLNDWNWQIEVDGVVVRDADGVKEGLQDKDWFTATTTKTTDIDAPEDNTIRVQASGGNITGSVRKAKLVVYLSESQTATTSIDLLQNSSNITLSPSVVPAVSKTGGESPLISVQGDASLQWELKRFTITDGSSSKDPVNHSVVLVDQNGDEIVSGTPYSVGTDKFRIQFGKIYYPNRDIPIRATVEVGIVGGGESTQSITVDQTPLTATGFYPVAPQTSGYGNIYAGSYNTYFRDGIRAMGTVKTALDANTNFYYTTTYGLGATNTWPITNDFRNTRDALTMVVSDYYTSAYIDAMNNSYSPLHQAGFVLQRSSGTQAVINTAESTTRVYQLLVGGAVDGIPALSTDVNFVEDGISSQANAYPVTAVPLVVQSGTERAFLAIDPKTRLIYLGESQLFGNVVGRPLAENLMVYIKNAALYGSHFTDLMVDGVDAPAAPWDAEYWGANAGIAR